jgi:hypothetical protein
LAGNTAIILINSSAFWAEQEPFCFFLTIKSYFMLKKALKLGIVLFLIGNGVFAQQWNGSSTPSGDIFRDGNIGIGTTTVTGNISFGYQGNHLTMGKPGFSKQVILATGWTNVNSDYTDIMVPGTNPNNVALLRLQSDGSLGIRTTTPTGDLSFGSQGNHLTIGNPGFLNQTILATGWTGANGDFVDLKVPGTDPNNSALVRIQSNGNVGIGTATPGSFKLAVEGKIGAREVQVTLSNPFPDYVFDSKYKLRSLSSLENYINKNKHLPNIPSAAEVEKNGGVELGQLNTKLLEKVEELTLYVIELNKKVEKLEKENEGLKKAK